MINHSEAFKDEQTGAILAQLNINPDQAGWSDDSDSVNTWRPTRRLKHRDGHGIVLRWDDRLKISGVWPKNTNGEVHTPRHAPQITVAPTRSARAIANEITNRFLPLYLPLFTEQSEGVAKQNDYAALTERTKAALLALPGFRQASNGQDAMYIHGYHPYTVSVNGSSVRIEAFSMPIDVALKVLPLLETHE